MSPSVYRRVSLGCALCAMLLGALTLIGWTTGMEALASIRRNYIPMAPSTALAFAILGGVMLAKNTSGITRAGANILLAAVALVAFGKLFEFFWGGSLGIEEMLVADPAMFGTVRKGRMSPITAFNFLMVCSAIFASRTVKLRSWAGPAATVTMAISFVVVLGYMHGTPLLYGGDIIPVALPTALAFFLVGISVIAEAGRSCWPLRPLTGDSTRALLLRSFLPVVIVTALIDGFARTRFHTAWEINPALSSALSTLFYTVVVAAVIVGVARSVGGRIDRAESERNAARKELEQLNADLENRIAERTRELSGKNEQMQDELTMARELQLALLPQCFPTVPRSVSPRESALRFFSFYYPTGTVSGDFFDVFPISDTSVGIFICDVMGHGVRAALVTSMMRALLEQHSRPESDPGRLLTEINAHLHAILKNAETSLFATALFMVADIERSELIFANAGHPKPFHIRRGRTEVIPLVGSAGKGPALGLFPGVPYATARVSIAPSDMIMLFTDGLFEVEAPDEHLYTQEDLLNVVRKRSALPSQELLEGVLSDIRDFTQRADFDDDVCLIGMEYSPRNGAVKARAAEVERITH